jgi:predicted GIY-YIG superfamily endonuclease
MEDEMDISEDEFNSEEDYKETSSLYEEIISKFERMEIDDKEQEKDNSLKNFCIYKIIPKQECKALYIGSTTNFKRRKNQHKKNSKNKFKKEVLYEFIRALGGFDNFICEKVLEFPCETREEGLKKEKELIEKMNATLNTVMLPKTK